MGKQYMGELMEHISNISELSMEEDPTLIPGGCVVETDANVIDMSFEARMEHLFASFNPL